MNSVSSYKNSEWMLDTNFGGGLGFAHEVYFIAKSALDLTEHLSDS